jgi:hypothetical protein
MAKDFNVSMLLPYFYRYLEYGEFPDRRGMIDQPVALVNAMMIFVSYYRKFEKEDFDKRMKT